MVFDLVFDATSEEDVLDLLQELESRMVNGEIKGKERPDITHQQRYLETIRDYEMGDINRIPLVMNMGMVRSVVARAGKGVITEEEELTVINRLLQEGLTPVEKYVEAIEIGEYIAGRRKRDVIPTCFHGIRKQVEKVAKDIVNELFDVDARLKDIKVQDFTAPVMTKLSEDIMKRLQDGEGKGMDLKDEMKLMIAYSELQAKVTKEDDQGANTFNMAIFMSQIKEIDPKLLPSVVPEFKLIG